MHDLPLTDVNTVMGVAASRCQDVSRERRRRVGIQEAFALGQDTKLRVVSFEHVLPDHDFASFCAQAARVLRSEDHGTY
jgi:hypothetical protein